MCFNCIDTVAFMNVFNALKFTKIDLYFRCTQHTDSIREEVRQFQHEMDSKIESIDLVIKQWKTVCMARKSDMNEWMAKIAQSLEHIELKQKDLV